MASSYLDPHFISPPSDTPEWQIRGNSPAPTVMTRQSTPAPMTTGAAATPKKAFMSKLFGRKKSKPTLKRTSTIQTILAFGEDASLGQTRIDTPAPVSRRATSPFHDLTEGRPIKVSDAPLPRLPSVWSPFTGIPSAESEVFRQGAETAMSTYTSATISFKPKNKRSFSALASLFRPGVSPPEMKENFGLNTPKRRGRRGTIKSAFSPSKHVKVSSRSSSFGTLHLPDRNMSDANHFSRNRASTVISLPPQSPSLAMLFDASQAEASNTFESSFNTSPITYTPLRKSPGLPAIYTGHQERQPQARSSQSHASTLMKSRSTPDLSLHAKKQSIAPSPTFPPSPFARSPGRPLGGDPINGSSRMSLAFRARSPSLKLGMPTSPTVPKSPMSMKMPSGLPVSSSPHGRSHLVPAKERSYSPAPSGYAMSTISKRANKTFLDQILDLDLGDMAKSSDMDPWAFGLSDDDKENEEDQDGSPPKIVSGLSVKVAKEFRPNTGGTFGRPQTGNRPNTGNRPTTGVSRPDTAATDRPDTGMSAYLGSHATLHKHKPSALRLDGRMRRISTASDADPFDEAREDEIEDSLPSAPPSSSQLSFNLDNLDSSLQIQAKTKDDSGFDDLSVSKHLNISALGQASKRPLSNCSAPPDFLKRVLKQADFRPTTADTTHLPLDLPDLDIAFDPRASLGSMGRQSSVSTLSDFEKEPPRSASTIQLLDVNERRDHRLSMPNPATSSLDQDSTPKKHASTIVAGWRKKSFIEPSFSTIETAISSVSPSGMSRILSRKHLEDSMFATKPASASKATTSKEIGIQTEPPTPTIVMTFADADVPLYTPHSGHSSGASRLNSGLCAAETARINDPHDPYADSYFPPVHTLLPGLPVSPFPPSSASSATPAPANSIRATNAESDIVSKLLEQLEKETVHREALEYSLASLRESTGAGLRRSDQKIKELMEENKALLDKLAKMVSIH